jgi:hypothetical protein
VHSSGLLLFNQIAVSKDNANLIEELKSVLE